MDELKAVREAREGLDCLAGGGAVERGLGSDGIEHGEGSSGVRLVVLARHGEFEAFYGWTAGGVLDDFSLGEVDPAGDEVVIVIEDGDVGRLLEMENVLLRGGVGGHRVVTVEMVGKNIGDDGNVRGPLDLRGFFEHEAGEFEDDPVGVADGGQIEEEGFADVAAEKDRGILQPGFEGFEDECGGGGFSDGAGDTNGFAGATLEEEVDFGGVWNALSGRRPGGHRRWLCRRRG